MSPLIRSFWVAPCNSYLEPEPGTLSVTLSMGNTKLGEPLYHAADCGHSPDMPSLDFEAPGPTASGRNLHIKGSEHKHVIRQLLACMSQRWHQNPNHLNHTWSLMRTQMNSNPTRLLMALATLQIFHLKMNSAVMTQMLLTETKWTNNTAEMFAMGLEKTSSLSMPQLVCYA